MQNFDFDFDFDFDISIFLIEIFNEWLIEILDFFPHPTVMAC